MNALMLWSFSIVEHLLISIFFFLILQVISKIIETSWCIRWFDYKPPPFWSNNLFELLNFARSVIIFTYFGSKTNVGRHRKDLDSLLKLIVSLWLIVLSTCTYLVMFVFCNIYFVGAGCFVMLHGSQF